MCVEAMQGKVRRDTGSVQCVWRLYKGRLEGTQAVCSVCGGYAREG